MTTAATAFGARPIVSLKSSVKIEKQADGTYTLVESGNKEWSSSHTETITITEESWSGLAEGAEIQYGWSESDTTAPSTWTTTVLSNYSTGAQSTSFTVTGEGLTGKYYLWVKPVSLSNIGGTYQTETEIAGPYYFDSTAPKIKIGSDGNGGNTTWSKTHTETVTITEENSGLIEGATLQYGWSTSQTVEPTTWTTATLSDYSEGDTTLSFTATGEGLTGKYYLWVKPVTLQDTVGNSRTEMKVSEEYYFDNEGPQITIGSATETGLTASTLTAEDYGGYVTNYTPTNGVNDEGTKWRIFHTDGENIYLIADSYVPLTNEAATKNYVPTGYSSTSGTYGFDLMAYSNYNGTADIASGIKTKWLSKYTTASTNTNAKATAYLLDTNAWSGFKDSTYAEYAVGGPTLDLFAESYNKTHTDRTIETQVTSAGYQVAWSGGGFEYYIDGLNTSESLYVISNTFDGVYGMWLASPSAGDAYSVMYVSSYGAVSNEYFNYYGVRCSPASFSKI